MKRFLKHFSLRHYAALLLGGLLLVACSPSPETAVVSNAKSAGKLPQTLRGLAGKPVDMGEKYVFQPGSALDIPFQSSSTGQNCVINAFNTPGQGYRMSGSGYRMSGSTGGLTTLPPEYTYTKGRYRWGSVASRPAATLSPAQSGAELIRTLGRAGGNLDAAYDSAVVVVDDFGKDAYFLNDHVYRFQDVYGDTLTTPLFEMLVTKQLLSHGAVVLNHVNAVIYGTSMYDLLNVEKTEVIWKHRQSGALLVVKAVNTYGFDTDYVAVETSKALNELQNNYGILKGSVNMSFAVVPCDTVDNFIQYRDYFDNFWEYLEALADVNNVVTSLHEELFQAVTTPFKDDALHRFIGKQSDVNSEKRGYVYVASSGNFSMPYQMYPAAWEEVVGVSASSEDEPFNRAFFSNDGEVMDKGAWFELLNFKDLVNGSRVSPQLFYAGTSFSAPNVSVFSAVDMSLNNPVCGFNGSRPYLAYASDPQLTNRPIAAQNLFLSDALASLCP